MDQTLFARTGREIKKIAKTKPAEHGLPFSTWSPAKLAGFLVAEGRARKALGKALRPQDHTG